MKTIDIELTEKLRNLVGKHLISSTSTTVSTKDAINIYKFVLNYYQQKMD